MKLDVGHPRPSSVEAQLCTVGVLVGTHQCATVSRMTLWQRAKPVRAVGESPVILSRLANVFVSLSSVRVFRIVKLYLWLMRSVECGNTYTPARRQALPCELSVVSNCPTPLFNVTRDVIRRISSSPAVHSESLQLSFDHKLFIRHAVCSRRSEN